MFGTGCMNTNALTPAIFCILVLTLAMAFVALPVQANDTQTCASEVVDYWQGPDRYGNQIDPSAPNSNPTNAIGPADSTYNHPETFFSLGFDGWIILEFNNYVGGSITVYETTWQHPPHYTQYPLETVDVSVSEDGTNWTLLGTATNNGQSPANEPTPTTFQLETCVKYVKVVDTTVESNFPYNANGFDVDAVCGEYVCPTVIDIYVDIKPGSWPNPINTGSKGKLPVAICGTEDFDVMTIDPETVNIGGVYPLRWSYKDVATPYTGDRPGGHRMGSDGYLDLVMHFDRQALVEALGLTDYVGQTFTITIQGNLTDDAGGTPIEGEDYARIKAPKGKGKNAPKGKGKK